MPVFFRRKLGGTYLAHELPFGTIVFIQVDAWSIAARTLTVFVNVAFRSAADRLDRFVIILIAPLKLSHEITIVPRLYIED